MNNQDGQSIKDITATLRGGQPQPSPPGASSKTRHPGSQNLSSTRPALTRSSANAGHAVKEQVFFPKTVFTTRLNTLSLHDALPI